MKTKFKKAETPGSPWQEVWAMHAQRKGAYALSAVTVGLKTSICFLLLVGVMCLFLCSTLVNVPTSGSRHCYQQPATKNTK